MKGLAKRNNKTRGKTNRKRKNRGKTTRRKKSRGKATHKRKNRGGGDGLSGATTAERPTAEQLKQYGIQEEAAKKAAEATGAKYTGPSASPGFRINAAGNLTKDVDTSQGRQSVFQKDMDEEGQYMDDEHKYNQQKVDMGIEIGGKKRKSHKRK
jgi:hypothetical protein